MTDAHSDRPTREKGPAIPVPEGHPIHTLMREHELLLEFSERLVSIAGTLAASRDQWLTPAQKEEIRHLTDHLVESESHYVREENVLFPIIEKHGITGPTQMMWTEHNEIRTMKKGLSTLSKKADGLPFAQFVQFFNEAASALADLLASHYNKENSILFPAALRVIAESDWPEIRRQFDELGYCCFTPPPAAADAARGHTAPAAGAGGTVTFPTGTLSAAELSALLDTLPVDVTFVDKDDTVRYFNQAADRIFPRAKAIIGRTVQNCHPKKSLDRVQAILDGFRNGTLPAAEFWIPMDEKLVYIRYLPVRDAGGAYLGCLEVTQDIAPIKKIEGQKRLL